MNVYPLSFKPEQLNRAWQQAKPGDHVVYWRDDLNTRWLRKKAMECARKWGAKLHITREGDVAVYVAVK